MQSYSHSSPPDQKEVIVWVRFFCYTDVSGYEELDKVGNSPTLLVFGYSNGIQMWNLLVSLLLRSGQLSLTTFVYE